MKEQVIFIDNYGLVVGKFESIQQFNEWFKTQKKYRPNKDFSNYKLYNNHGNHNKNLIIGGNNYDYRQR